MELQTQAAAPAVVTPYKVGNFDHGTAIHTVSSQWFNRPADQRFLSLSSLYDAVKLRSEQSRADVIDVRDVRVLADSDKPDALRLVLPSHRDDTVTVEPTHWSFGQLASLLQLPAAYLRKLPATIAAINLQYGLSNFREETVKSYVRQNGRTELLAATGPEYGRIFDHQVVEAVQRIAGNGTGDTRWKIPGMLNWGNMKYDPLHPVSKDTTTLFASDRDVFLFLVDDTHPIEIGKLPDGSPDLIFRGFMVWNSEFGSKSFGVSTFYLRGICCNRILWGVEGYESITMRHSKGAPMRFAGEVSPALESFSNNATTKLLSGIQSARDAIVATTDDERAEFLGRNGFNKPEAKAIIAAVLNEEGKPARSIWDMVQGITAVARGETHQDDRITMERRAGALLAKVA